LELKLRAAADESEAVKSEFDRVNNDYKRLKVKCVDLEEKQNKKTHDIEKLIKEKDQVIFNCFILI
jgi:predicted nuclease with TOPRIM domain